MLTRCIRLCNNYVNEWTTLMLTGLILFLSLRTLFSIQNWFVLWYNFHTKTIVVSILHRFIYYHRSWQLLQWCSNVITSTKCKCHHLVTRCAHLRASYDETIDCIYSHSSSFTNIFLLYEPDLWHPKACLNSFMIMTFITNYQFPANM